MKIYTLLFGLFTISAMAQIPLNPGTYSVPPGTTITVPAPSPAPTPSPNNATIIAPTSAVLVDSSGNSWGISSNGAVVKNGITDATYTSNVVELAYTGGAIYQQNSSGTWYKYPGVSGWWTQVSNPLPTPTPTATPTPTSTATPTPSGVLTHFGAGIISSSAPTWGCPVAPSAYFNMMECQSPGCGWGDLEPSQGSFNWSQLTSQYQYCQANGMWYLWHNPLYQGGGIPGWVAGLSGAQAMAAYANFIQAAAAQCPNIQIIECCNEPLEHSGSDSFLGQYVNTIAPWNGAQFVINGVSYGWVAWSVSVIHQYFPNAVIVPNDFNVETADFSGAHAAYIALGKACQPYGGGGVGLEGYFGQGFDSPSASTLASGLADFANAGLPVYFTEGPTIVQTDDTAQVNQTQLIYSVVLANTNVRDINLFYLGDNGPGEPPGPGSDWFQPSSTTPRPAFTWLVNNVPLPFKHS